MTKDEKIERACNPVVGDVFRGRGGITVTVVGVDEAGTVSLRSESGVTAGVSFFTCPYVDWRKLATNTINNGGEFVPAQTATQARDEAMERAMDGAEARLVAIAIGRVLAVPEGTFFTTDDLDPVPFREPRAWGPIMRKLAKDGHISATHGYRDSTRVTCHGRPKRLWVKMTGARP